MLQHDERAGRYAERNEPDTKGQTLHDPTYMRSLNLVHSYKQTVEWW